MTSTIAVLITTTRASSAASSTSVTTATAAVAVSELEIINSHVERLDRLLELLLEEDKEDSAGLALAALTLTSA